MKKLDNYNDLKKTFDYDKQKATRLAEAVTEAIEVTNRLKYLRKVIDDNEILQPFLWTTAEGVTKAIHDIEDSHLENIIKHLARNGRNVSEQLIAEAESRNIDVETLKATTLLTGDGIDDEYGDEMDWDN